MPTGILFGIAFAAVAIAMSRVLVERFGRALFAILLGAAAAVYVGAALGTQAGSTPIEVAGFVVFGAIALWGWERAWVLAVGWLAHSAWDLLHLGGVLGSNAPEWYQIGCLVADPILAAYLVYWAAVRARPTRVDGATSERNRV